MSTTQKHIWTTPNGHTIDLTIRVDHQTTKTVYGSVQNVDIICDNWYYIIERLIVDGYRAERKPRSPKVSAADGAHYLIFDTYRHPNAKCVIPENVADLIFGAEEKANAEKYKFYRQMELKRLIAKAEKQTEILPKAEMFDRLDRRDESQYGAICLEEYQDAKRELQALGVQTDTADTTKQFFDKEDLDTYVSRKVSAIYKKVYGDDFYDTPKASDIIFYNPLDTDNDVLDTLIADGYDPDNLIMDGHYYNIGGHTNHGYKYEDEVDINAIMQSDLPLDHTIREGSECERYYDYYLSKREDY